MLKKEFHLRFTLADVGKLLAFSPVIVVIVYAIICLPWASEDAPGWVQAIGSIVAIIAAGCFPIWHSSLDHMRQQRSRLELMRVLADDSAQALFLLTNCFVMPEHEVAWMRQYLQNHRDRDWPHLLDGLAQVPVAEIPPQRASDLARIRDAVQFGASVAAMIPEWIDAESSHPEVLATLRSQRDLLMLIRSTLPIPAGVKDEPVDAQLRGQSHENFLNSYTLSGARVYRRYYNYGLKDGEVPRKVQVQIVMPYGHHHPSTFVLEAPDPGWEDIYEAEREVRKQANKYLDDMVAHELMNTPQYP